MLRVIGLCTSGIQGAGPFSGGPVKLPTPRLPLVALCWYNNDQGGGPQAIKFTIRQTTSPTAAPGSYVDQTYDTGITLPDATGGWFLVPVATQFPYVDVFPTTTGSSCQFLCEGPGVILPAR
jgi:hypothetical protein